MESKIAERLEVILKTSDLNSTTEKSIRKQIQSELNTDLSAYKLFIREEIQKYLEAEAIRQSQEVKEERQVKEEQAPVDEKPAEKKKGGYPCLLSPELAAFLGSQEMPRTQVVKAIWEYIRKHNLQDPSNKRKIIIDEQLGKIFKPPLDMFKMNKQLSRHCKSDDRGHVSRSSKVKVKKKIDKPAKKSKKKGKADQVSGEKKKGGGGFGTVQLLEPLRSFVGVDQAPRAEIVKKIWAYIKANNCKDPNNGRNIVPDSTLAQFLTPPVDMFNMNKQIQQYIQKIPSA